MATLRRRAGGSEAAVEVPERLATHALEASEVDIQEPIPVVVNGEELRLPPGSDLAALLGRLDIPPRHIAVELNGDLHEGGLDTPLQPGDSVEIVRFVGGG